MKMFLSMSHGEDCHFFDMFNMTQLCRLVLQNSLTENSLNLCYARAVGCLSARMKICGARPEAPEIKIYIDSELRSILERVGFPNPGQPFNGVPVLSFEEMPKLTPNPVLLTRFKALATNPPI